MITISYSLNNDHYLLLVKQWSLSLHSLNNDHYLLLVKQSLSLSLLSLSLTRLNSLNNLYLSLDKHDHYLSLVKQWSLSLTR